MRLLRLTSALIDPSIIRDKFDHGTSVTFLDQTFCARFSKILYRKIKTCQGNNFNVLLAFCRELGVCSSWVWDFWIGLRRKSSEKDLDMALDSSENPRIGAYYQYIKLLASFLPRCSIRLSTSQTPSKNRHRLLLCLRPFPVLVMVVVTLLYRKSTYWRLL